MAEEAVSGVGDTEDYKHQNSSAPGLDAHAAERSYNIFSPALARVNHGVSALASVNHRRGWEDSHPSRGCENGSLVASRISTIVLFGQHHVVENDEIDDCSSDSAKELGDPVQR